MKSLRIQVDQDRVRQLGVSSKSLAEALNAVTSGMVVTEVRDSIKARYPNRPAANYSHQDIIGREPCLAD
jgi:multidrug efflux pump subunit AcrB